MWCALVYMSYDVCGILVMQHSAAKCLLIIILFELATEH